MTTSDPKNTIDRTTLLPPESYWDSLTATLPDHPVADLRRKSDTRVNAFRASDLPPPRSSAYRLLEQLAADRWVVAETRHSCPNCEYELTTHDIKKHSCPDCDAEFLEYGGVVQETVFARNVSTRKVDWVVAIHGMNTSGEWQEEFSWYFSTTWGRSVPVSVYKYGIVIAGVLMPWRRRKLQMEFRAKFIKLREQAEARGFSGKPDVIAHSFGTWLLGHMLENELKLPAAERLQVGRVILTGCVLRPDFNWTRLKEKGVEIVEEVLCHYGTSDPIVPLAHYVIADSGPSGKRGFDGEEVINVMAKGFADSDLFSVDKCVVDGTPLQPRSGAENEVGQLEDSYQRYWRPFLQRSSAELKQLPDRLNPSHKWLEAPWPLRGTVLPFFLLPLSVLVVLMIIGFIGECLWQARPVLSYLVGACSAGLLVLLLGVIATKLWRLCWPPKRN